MAPKRVHEFLHVAEVESPSDGTEKDRVICGESRMREICNAFLLVCFPFSPCGPWISLGLRTGCLVGLRTETMVRRRMPTKMAMKKSKMPLLMLPMIGNQMSMFAKPAGWFILKSNCC